MTRLKKLIWKFYREFIFHKKFTILNLRLFGESLDTANKRIDKQKERVNNLIERYKKKHKIIENDIITLNLLMENYKDVINVFDTDIKNLSRSFKMLDVKEAEKRYNTFLKELTFETAFFKNEIKEFLDFKNKDQSIVRLASLEERITKLESKIEATSIKS